MNRRCGRLSMAGQNHTACSHAANSEKVAHASSKATAQKLNRHFCRSFGPTDDNDALGHIAEVPSAYIAQKHCAHQQVISLSRHLALRIITHGCAVTL